MASAVDVPGGELPWLDGEDVGEALHFIDS
jgi:hypothetical protein